jgi:lipoate-protein ligase A
MRYLKNPHIDPYFNMAFDEYCLEKLSIDEPVFFLWQNRPSVIIGANQEVHTEVNLDYLKENDISLVRRVTGGGAVYHDLGNLNYTIVGSSDDLERDYPEYTRYMLQALQKLGIPATMSGRNDILVEGRKVSGFAKRVCKNRLMIHGTLMFDVKLEQLTQALCPPESKLQSKGIASVRSRVANLCEYLPEITDISIFKQKLESILSNNYTDQEWKLSQEDIQNIEQLAHDKFEKWEWIYGHSPRATLNFSKRLACGTVHIHLNIAENRINSCQLGCDFIGNLPTNELEKALTSLPYDRDAIYKILTQMDVSRYFDGVTAIELLQLIIQ